MGEGETLEKATTKGLRYLSYRPRSEAEVRRHLRLKYPIDVVELVIERLREQGLLDDRAFAHAWSQSRTSSRPRSAALIRRELLGKGIAQEIAQATVESLDDEESAYNAGVKAAMSLAGADYDTFRRRLWGYLHRRGFGDSLIRRALHRLWDERQEIESRVR